MSPHEMTAEIGIVIAKTLTLVLGGTITYYSWRAYSRTGSRSLRALSIGFGVMTAGLVGAGVANLAVGVPIVFSVLFESILTMIALAIIVYSLYVK